MICAEAKNLLSPYLEENFDSQTKKLLDEHLAVCHDCSRELAELKNLISGLKAFPVVEPPQDFLESVRRRLDKPLALNAVLRRMFVPWHIKLPLEALTVTATVIIIFFLVHKTEIEQFNPPLKESKGKETIVGVGQSITEKEARQLYTGRSVAVQERFPAYSLGVNTVHNERIYKGALSTEELSSRGISAGGDGMHMEIRNAAVAYGDRAGATAVSLGKIKMNNTVSGYAAQAMLGHQVINGYSAFSLPELELVIKSRDLSTDSLHLETILKGLQVVNFSKDIQNDKAIFKFSLLSFQWSKLLAELKNWQIEKIPARELPTAGRPYSVKIVLIPSP